MGNHCQARAVAEEFLSLYETHVLKPLDELEKEIKRTALKYPLRSSSSSSGSSMNSTGDTGASVSGKSNDPLGMVRQIGAEEYARWSPAARGRALAWLCDEALSAVTMNDLVKKVLEAREVMDRKDREVRGEEGQERRREGDQMFSGARSVFFACRLFCVCVCLF